MSVLNDDASNTNDIIFEPYEIGEQNEVVNNESDSDCSILLNTTKFRNNNKSSYKPVRQLFKIQKSKTGTFEGYCSLCPTVIQMGNNSDVNLRSHLAYKHGKSEFLTESQRRRIVDKIESTPCNAEDKRVLDDAILECIHTDSRPINDFLKPGIRKLLELIKPGYKPMCCKTINKKSKVKYVKTS